LRDQAMNGLEPICSSPFFFWRAETGQGKERPP